MFDVTDDANDLAPASVLLFVPVSCVDSLADRVLVRPVLECESLINNRDEWSVGIIAIVKEAAPDERDAHRLKVGRACIPDIPPGHHISGGGNATLDIKACARAVSGHWN